MSVTFALLEAQHQEVLARLDEIDAVLGAPCADLAGFHRFLDAEVAAHFDLEERAFFPVLARHPGLAEGPVAVMFREHAAFRAHAAAFADALRREDATAQTAIAIAVIDLLRVHIAKEDEVLFALARAALSPGELQEIEARRQALPSMPGAPSAHGSSEGMGLALPSTSNGGTNDDSSHT